MVYEIPVSVNLENKLSKTLIDYIYFINKNLIVKEIQISYHPKTQQDVILSMDINPKKKIYYLL